MWNFVVLVVDPESGDDATDVSWNLIFAIMFLVLWKKDWRRGGKREREGEKCYFGHKYIL